MRRSQAGFTIVESLVAIAIVMIFIFCAMTVIDRFNYQSSDAKDKLRARALLTQVSADVAAAPQMYPTVTMSGSQAGYVLCYDQNLSPVSYDLTDDVGIVKIDDLEPVSSTEGDRPRFCNSKFEVRVIDYASDTEPRITVYQYFAARSLTTIKRMVSSVN